MKEQIQEALKAFEDEFGDPYQARTFFCPGRVNLIGEHIDYNGGYVFPAAVSMGIAAAVRLRMDDAVHVYSTNFGTGYMLNPGRQEEKDERLDWANYPLGVLVLLRRQGVRVPGMEIAFSGNLPDGSGLSSSAAIEILTAYLALVMGGKDPAAIDRKGLAVFCQLVENQFIGVNSGIMDQYAVANGRENHAMLLDCEKIEARQVPFHLKEHSIVIMDTRKPRQLVDSKYNERRAECERALAIVNQNNSYINLCDVPLDVAEKAIQDDVVRKRARHVITEQGRVLDAVEKLEKEDLEAFGALLDASHKSLKDDYEVTGPELDALVDAARSQPGCLGARMTGAGFGGCAIALVENGHVPDFQKAVAKQYAEAIGMEPGFYLSQAGEGVREVENKAFMID